MAVDITERKRKHEAATHEVPSKISKKHGKHKKSLDSQSKEENDSVENGTTVDNTDATTSVNNDSEALYQSGVQTEQVERKKKYSKDFKMLNFRTQLRGTNFMSELMHFISLAEGGPKIVAKYIEKRGKPLEIVSALEKLDDSNVEHISYVCQALQLVIMEILANHKIHMESAMHACRYFLKCHMNVVNILLKSSQRQHRCIALKLLTAIVCVEPQLGRQILVSCDILSNVRKVENFLSHSGPDGNSFETVRKCFIHFVLAYLVEGNVLLIRNILDHGALIAALAAGLVHDDSVTVCVVLNTLRKYVLECQDISKTTKVAVFNLNCCKHIVRLYDWNKMKAQKKTIPNPNDVSVEDAESVYNAVHEFLIVLLTSRKHGIAFDAVKNFRLKRNPIQGKIVAFISKPWCNERKTELVVKILQTCPEIARHTVRHFAGIVNPMRVAQKDLTKAIDFIAQIINIVHPKLLNAAMEEMTLTDLTFWIKDVCLPIETLALIVGAKLLHHKIFDIRLSVSRLLLVMFTQYANYMAVIRKREQAKGGNAMRRFKFDILNHILVNFPTIEDILYSLYMSIEFKNAEGVFVLNHLDVALDIVLIVCQENRSFVNKTSTILDYLELLRPLYTSVDTTSPNNENISLELKAIKTILLLFPKALEPVGNIFQSVLKSLINAFVHGSNGIAREAGSLLRKIFENTGIFDVNGYEIDLWLEALRFDKGYVDVVTQVLIEVLQVTNADVALEKPEDTMSEMENVHKLFDSIEKGMSVQSYVETLTASKLMPLIFKGVEVVEPLNTYLEIVCLLMYHCLPTPGQAYTLYAAEFKSMKKYMKGWLESGKMEIVRLNGTVAEKVPELCRVQQAILDGEDGFADIFGKSHEESDLELEINGKSIHLDRILRNERLIMIYIQQILFLVVQLAKKNNLQHLQAQRASEFIKNFMLVIQHVQKPDPIKGMDEDNETYLSKILKYIYTIRINCISNIDLMDITAEKNQNFLYFLSEVTECCKDMDEFEAHTICYRLKIVKALEISMETSREIITASGTDLKETLRLVQMIQLNEDNCAEILDKYASTLSCKDLLIPNGTQRTMFYDLLVYILHRVSLLRKAIRCDAFIEWLSLTYAEMCALDGDVNLDQLEDALREFLLVCHHCIPQLGVKFFDCFFLNRKITKPMMRLASLIMQRDESLHAVFLKHLPDQVGKKELIYPLLKVLLVKHVPIDEALLKRIYQECKNGFMKTIEKPQKAGVIYKENIETTIKLIELCMPNSECIDFCNKNFKFDGIEVYQMHMINAIYSKGMASLDKDNCKQRSMIFVNYVSVQVQMMLTCLKKQVLEEDKIELFAYFLYNWWRQAFTNENSTGDDAIEFTASLNFSRLLGQQQWLNFGKTCLKLCMYRSEVPDAQTEQQEHVGGLLLKLLAFLCDKLYPDWLQLDDKNNHMEEPLVLGNLFEMIFTHSNFYEIILGGRAEMVKTQILHLLFTLGKKCPSALQSKQIPIILGSYHATLSSADRYALALLNLYELYDCELQQYRPFIWGESAISFYALRETEEDRIKLKQEETTIAQVMSLLDKQLCEYTIENFPIWRKLNTLQQMPDVQFYDPEKKATQLGSNVLERIIECGDSINLKEIDLKLCPKREGLYEKCYDPAFFVPLMNICFASEAFAHPAQPARNGMLSMVFAALSSQDKDMRLAAANAHLRYRAHFEQRKFFEHDFWCQMYDNIQMGLSDLRDSWLQHKKNSGTPRVPFISGLFIAKTINLITDPTHLLYKKLAMYMRLKNSFNFQCVPEFNVLFYSDEVEHYAFQEFIVEIIRNGIKSSSDFHLLLSTNTLKVLMGFYGCSMSTLKMNLMLLSIISTCVKIPMSSKLLIENVGVLSWLESIISNIEFHQFDIIEGVISTLNNLWYALKANASEFHNFSYISAEIHRLIVSLIPHLTARIPVDIFGKLVNIISKTATFQHQALRVERLDQLMGVAEIHYPDAVRNIRNIKNFGAEGCASHIEYCKELFEQRMDATAILTLSSLREYIIKWSNSNRRSAAVE